MIGRLRDLTMNRDGTQNITVTVKADFREQFDKLMDKDLDIEVKQHREKRSKNANAYFHVLVNKIAGELNESDETVKTRLVIEYGAIAREICFSVRPARSRAERSREASHPACLTPAVTRMCRS